MAHTHTHTHKHRINGILLIQEKAWNCAICSNVDRPRGCYGDWNKSDKDKYYMISLTWWNIENTTNQWIQQKRSRLTDMENKLVATRGSGKGRVTIGVGETADSEHYKLLHYNEKNKSN